MSCSGRILSSLVLPGPIVQNLPFDGLDEILTVFIDLGLYSFKTMPLSECSDCFWYPSEFGAPVVLAALVFKQRTDPRNQLKSGLRAGREAAMIPTSYSINRQRVKRSCTNGSGFERMSFWISALTMAAAAAKIPRERTTMSDNFARRLSCNCHTSGIGRRAVMKSVTIVVTTQVSTQHEAIGVNFCIPVLKRPILVNVSGEKHLAVPVPNGGGRSFKFQVASIGTHCQI